jgi:hypothetical protein
VRQTLLKFYPYLYYIGQKNQIYTFKNLCLWICHSIVVGFIMFMIILKVTSEYPIDRFGHVSDIWFVSLTTYTSIIFIIDTKLIIITRSWTWLSVVGLLLLSIGIYIPFVFITDVMPEQFHTAYTALALFTSPVFWLLLLL